MARVLTAVSGLLICAATMFAHDVSSITPPIAEFPRQPIPFFEFHWAGETLFLSAREAIYRFRPDDDRPPEAWRAFSNEWDFVFIAPDGATVIAEDLDSGRGELTIHRQLMAGENGWRDERLIIPAGDAVPPWTAYSRDGKRAAILLPDWAAQRLQLKLYDLDAGTLVWVADLDETDQYLNQLEFSPDGRYLAVAGETNEVMVWDTALGKMTDLVTSPDEFDILRGVNFSPDGRWMYVTGFNELFVLELKQDGTGDRWTHATKYPLSVDLSDLLLSPDGRTLIGLSYMMGEIYIWAVDGQTLALQEVLTVEDGRWLLRMPTVSASGRYIAAADSDYIIRVWGW